MRTKDLEAYRQRLLDLRAKLREDIDGRIATVPEEVQKPGDISALPTHNADRDAEGLDEQVAVGRVQEEMLHEVEAALARIRDGGYGICQNCGEEIAAARLKALPYAAYCVRCEEEHERLSTTT